MLSKAWRKLLFIPSNDSLGFIRELYHFFTIKNQPLLRGWKWLLGEDWGKTSDPILLVDKAVALNWRFKDTADAFSVGVVAD